MSRLDWLIARPVAHRGLHDAASGVIENTASAAAAAVAAGYGLEVDLQITADGEAVVHHDHELGRLTEGAGRLTAMNAADLKRVPFKATADRIIALGDLCDLVASRSTLVLELKSRFDGDLRLPQRVADVLESYGGPVAAMSFDPRQIEVLRQIAPALARGIVAESKYGDSEWATLSVRAKRSLAYLAHAWRSRPQFIAYSVEDLPALPPLVARKVFGLPLLTWTVRTEEDRKRAARWADQMIFEGFRA